MKCRLVASTIFFLLLGLFSNLLFATAAVGDPQAPVDGPYTQVVDFESAIQGDLEQLDQLVVTGQASEPEVIVIWESIVGEFPITATVFNSHNYQTEERSRFSARGHVLECIVGSEYPYGMLITGENHRLGKEKIDLTAKGTADSKRGYEPVFSVLKYPLVGVSAFYKIKHIRIGASRLQTG